MGVDAGTVNDDVDMKVDHDAPASQPSPATSEVAGSDDAPRFGALAPKRAGPLSIQAALAADTPAQALGNLFSSASSKPATELNVAKASLVSAPESKPEPARKPDTIRGCLDVVTQGRAEGWAIDDGDPQKKLKIEIWDGETFAVLGEASGFRPDLKAAGIGGGYVFFSIPLPGHLHDGKEHVISARVAGCAAPLPKPITVELPKESLSASVDQVEGATAIGWIESNSDSWRTVELFVDNKPVQSIEVAPHSRETMQCELPIEFLDGCVHWFRFKAGDRFKADDQSAVIGDAVVVTPFVSTPEASLQRYARSFPAALSANTHRRYAALARQLALAPKVIAAQDDGPDKLDLATYIDQVATAHAQVMYGVNDRPGLPPVLRFIEYANPKVSIVIPAHNKFWVTYNCLAALLLAPNETTAEVIVVDDGSSDMTLDLGKFVKGVKILRNETAQGFIKSSNRGGQAARGEFVVMLNNDTEPCANWLDELLYVFDHFDQVGLVGAKLIYPSGKLQEAGGILFPNGDAWNYGRNQNPYEPRFNYIRQIDYCSGACIMLRKEIWDELNGFDELYTPAYYEDTDLAFRVRAMGLRTYYTPFSEIVHFEGISSGTSVTSGVKRYQAINEPKFRSRWSPTLRRLPGSMDPNVAKDRGVSLRALVIDAQTPQSDKDAGSYAALQEMQLMQALGVKLTFIGQNVAYLGNYTDQLQRMGIECLYAPYQRSVESVIEDRGREFDFFYITRYYVADRYVDLIREHAPRAKIVFCNADLHFLREIRAAIAAKNPELLPKAIETRDAELGIMEKVDVTLSYTDAEAAVILSHNMDRSKVMKCPWVVEVDDDIPPFTARKGVAFLGGYRHPPNEEAVLFFVNEVLPELVRKLPDVTFHIYGSDMPDSLKKLDHPNVVVEGYVQDVKDVYHRCRVFVAPLRSGAGIKGKVIGALASGTPTVVSPVAAEGIGISSGSEALIADTAADWVQAIASLYNDEPRWTEMSKRARALTVANFSFDVGLARMRSALAAAGIYVDG